MTALRAGEVRLRGVSRRYKVVHERNNTLKETLVRRRRIVATDLWVLDDVDIDIAPGESVGIVGRNGTGKSTLLKLVAGIIPPQSGTVEAGGVVASLLELGAGFHPDFSGYENIFMQGALYGLDKGQVRERLDDIVAFAELADFIEMPVKTYSSGMFMRLGFAIAAHVDADIMLLDEILAVGDAAFQRKCAGRISEFRRGGGTILFVSHSQEAVEQICDRAILLDEGHVIVDGPPHEVFLDYNRRLAARRGPAAVAAAESTASETWGSGRLRIRDVRLLGPDGPTDRLVSGDGVSVEMDVEPREPLANTVFGYEIHSLNGSLAYGTNTRMDGFSVDHLDGPATVTFRIPHVPLLEGRFLLSVTACSFDESDIYHHLHSCREFSVFPQTSGVGVVVVDTEWAIAPAHEHSPATGR